MGSSRHFGLGLGYFHQNSWSYHQGTCVLSLRGVQTRSSSWTVLGETAQQGSQRGWGRDCRDGSPTSPSCIL